MIKKLCALFLLSFGSFYFSQSITEIFTDYSYQRTVGGVTTTYNVWQSSNASISSVNPDKSHNLLAFTWNGITYSTGVNNALLSTVASSYNSQNFQAFPVSFIPAANSGTYIGVGNMYGGGAGNVTPIPVTNNLANYLVDGSHGLDLGTAIFNLPGSQQLTYQVVGVNPISIGDGIPDIVVTQVGAVPGSADKYKFIDSGGLTVGTEVNVNFSTVNRVGVGNWKFYSSYNNTIPEYVPGLQGTRDTRLLAFDWSEFGITTANAGDIKMFVQTLSGGSDTAFTAYNTNSVTLLQNISGTVFNDNNAGVPSGNGYSGATVRLLFGSTVIATQTTDSNGNYNFANVGPGNYTVSVTVPTNYVVVGNSLGTTNNSIPVTLTSTSGVNNINFGINLPPVATNDSGTGYKNTTLTLGVTSNDTDPNSGSIVSSTLNLVAPSSATSLVYDGTNLKGFTIAGQGIWLVNSSGVLTFTPANNFSGNATSVNYTVKDSAGLTSNIATISIFINSYCTKPASIITGGIPTEYGITTLTKSSAWPQNVPNGFIALESNSKGFTITRVQNSGLITDPKEGMLIYDIEASCVKLYNGSSWKCIQRDCNQ